LGEEGYFGFRAKSKAKSKRRGERRRKQGGLL